MAVRFDASGDQLTRSAPGSGDLTVAFWAYISVDRNNFSCFNSVGLNYDGTFRFIGTNFDGTQLLFNNGDDAAGSTLSVGTWYHITWIEDDAANTVRVYLNGTLDITDTGVTGARATSTMYFGNDNFAEWLNGRVAYAKVWSAVLSVADIQNEMHTAMPQRLNNLWAWYPMLPGTSERVADYSGNGRGLTAGGTLTDELGPPVAWDYTIPIITLPPAGAGSQTIGPPALLQNGALYAPTVIPDQAITPGLLSGTGALYAPTLIPDQVITVGLLSGTGALYAPSLIPDQTITVGLLSGTGALYAPTQLSLNLAVGLLSGTGALYAPVLIPDQVVTVGLLSGTGALYAPVISAGGAPQTVTPGLLSGTGALYAPQLDLNLTVGLLSGTGVLYALGIGRIGLQFRGQNNNQIDRVRIPRESPLGTDTPADIGAGDFTIELWINCAYADNTSTATDVRNSNVLVDLDILSNPEGMVFGVTRSGGNLVVIWGVAEVGLTWDTILGSKNIGDSRWHHVAVVRNSTSGLISLYVDGGLEASDTYTTNSLEYPDGLDPGGGQDNEYIVLAVEKHDFNSEGYIGYIDSIRVSDNQRYTDTFVPVHDLADDANSRVLINFIEGQGTTASNESGSPDGELLVGGSPSSPTWESTMDVVYAVFTDIVQSGALYAPTASVADVIGPPDLLQSGALYAPQLDLNIGPPALLQSGALYAPQLDLNLTVGLLSGTGVLYAPVLIPDQVVTVGLLSGTGALYAPDIVISGQIAAPLLSGTGVLYAPVVIPDQIVTVGLLSGTGALYAPQLNLSFAVGLLSGTGALYAPQLDLNLTVGLLSGTGALYAPTLTRLLQTITLGAALQNGALYAPVVSVPSGIIGLVTLTVTSRQPTATVTSRQPTVTVTSRQPSVTVEAS